MPELPEVETTVRGIRPHIVGRHIAQLVVHQSRLRHVFDEQMQQAIHGQQIGNPQRRAKYILIPLDRGTLLVHLGMSGSLRIVTPSMALRPHDHIEFQLSDGNALRYHDPRRFGLVLWDANPVDALLQSHPLLATLGPEPLSPAFNAHYLAATAQRHTRAIKAFIMDAHVVVGVGNIYANEALFLAGIHPQRGCHRISLARYEQLVAAIKLVLERSIDQGGTTLRDFVREDGQPGYFAQSLQVYGRSGKPCHRCGTLIKTLQIGQRTSFYCPRCQH